MPSGSFLGTDEYQSLLGLGVGLLPTGILHDGLRWSSAALHGGIPIAIQLYLACRRLRLQPLLIAMSPGDLDLPRAAWQSACRAPCSLGGAPPSVSSQPARLASPAATGEMCADCCVCPAAVHT